MDHDSEIAKFKWLLMAGILFVGSGFVSVREIRYWISGRKAEARILRIEETTSRGRYGATDEFRVVTYDFEEPGGNVRKEQDRVDRGWPVPEVGTIPVEYLAGTPGASRIRGNNRQGVVWLFGGSVVLLAAALYRVGRMAHEPIRRSGHRQSR